MKNNNVNIKITKLDGQQKISFLQNYCYSLNFLIFCHLW